MAATPPPRPSEGASSAPSEASPRRDCAGKARGRTTAKAAARLPATPLLAKSPVALLEGAHGAQEIGLPEHRPLDVVEVNQAVPARPVEEPRQTHLPARPHYE